MAGVRVLVGTRKGAFVLTSDERRQTWDVAGPHFGGWEIYHVDGSPVDPDRLYASQSTGWFGQLIQRSDDGGEDLGAGRQGLRVRRGAGHPPVVRRHAAPVGVRPGLAPGAVADRPGHRLRRSRGRGAVPLHRRRRQLAGAAAACASTARARSGSRARAGCACTRSCSDPQDCRPDVRGDLRGRGVPHRRRRRDVGAGQRGPALRRHPDPRPPRSGTACTTWRCTRPGPTRCSCRSTGT